MSGNRAHPPRWPSQDPDDLNPGPYWSGGPGPGPPPPPPHHHHHHHHPGYGSFPPYGFPPRVEGYGGYPSAPPPAPPPFSCPPGQYPPAGPPGQYPPAGPPGQYPPAGPPGQYPPAGPPGQYPPAGPPGQYPPAGPPGQYPPAGPPGQFPPAGPAGQYPPAGPAGQYPPAGPAGQYPPAGPPGQYPPAGPPGQYPPAGPPGQGTPSPHPSTRTGLFSPAVGDRLGHTGPLNVQMYDRSSSPGPGPGPGPARVKDPVQVQGLGRPPLDERVVQRRQDEQWIRQFLQRRRRAAAAPEEETAGSAAPPAVSESSPSRFREALYGALRLVSQLSLAGAALEQNLEDRTAWTALYPQAQDLKAELREKLEFLKGCGGCGGGGGLERLKRRLLRVSERRVRLKRRRLEKREELAEDRFAEKEAAIDKWRMKRIQAVEEKKRERELKVAADSVLCEVRKKQADVKRMQDILRSLEKLRKLRKEAASRKGIFPDGASEQQFGEQLERLRALIRTRTAVYAAEENALRVMLEGEQEEERKRDLEKKRQKERERQLQKKREVDAMLFGDEVPADPRQQPFREYYTQAERSLPALVQIRREWDMFLVPTDQAGGSTVPQGWVLPEPPSDNTWATALV